MKNAEPLGWSSDAERDAWYAGYDARVEEETRTAPSDGEGVREVLEQAAIWHDDQDKAISKQPNANVGDNGWRRLQHQEQASSLRSALATTPSPDASPDSGCAASPDHADILATIENAADDWQRKGYKSALAEVRDMANVGRALMEALPEGYSYNDCPSEIVTDLMNQRDDALAGQSPSPAIVKEAGEVEPMTPSAEAQLHDFRREHHRAGREVDRRDRRVGEARRRRPRGADGGAGALHRIHFAMWPTAGEIPRSGPTFARRRRATAAACR